MGMKVVFCLNIAKDKRIRNYVRLSQRIYLIQGLIQNLQLFFFHLDDATHED